jgi:hypothetical protein
LYVLQMLLVNSKSICAVLIIKKPRFIEKGHVFLVATITHIPIR